jgi:hypothetical protein
LGENISILFTFKVTSLNIVLFAKLHQCLTFIKSLQWSNSYFTNNFISIIQIKDEKI